MGYSLNNACVIGSSIFFLCAGKWGSRSEIGRARNCRVPDCRVPVGKWGIRSEIGGLRNCRVSDCRVPDCRVPDCKVPVKSESKQTLQQIKQNKKHICIYIYKTTGIYIYIHIYNKLYIYISYIYIYMYIPPVGWVGWGGVGEPKHSKPCTTVKPFSHCMHFISFHCSAICPLAWPTLPGCSLAAPGCLLAASGKAGPLKMGGDPGRGGGATNPQPWNIYTSPRK